jgi:hypothetical protein
MHTAVRMSLLDWGPCACAALTNPRPALQQMEAKYEDERRRCLTEIEQLRKRATEKEAAIQKAATRQIEGLTTQVTAAGLA